LSVEKNLTDGLQPSIGENQISSQIFGIDRSVTLNLMEIDVAFHTELEYVSQLKLQKN
jgi:hypothetical protein